ncbi:hypothetical protein ACFVSW_17720 [Neobacillus sp. NPDC058068]|uniref:hypothetical protein n=1 Tax=Neobacillus sp. NPDC058068 TaxID=3346325 RepID=UPI0036D983E8
MSNPNIGNITPTISLSVGQTVPLLLASIALEELALAHLVNAEAEKLQLVLGTLTPTGATLSPATVSLTNLLTLNASVQRTLRDVIKKEMLLEFKFENILDLIALTPGLVGPTPLACPCNATLNFHMGGVSITVPGVGVVTGDIDLTGAICPSCGPAGSMFTFNFDSAPPGFSESFIATTITSVTCPVLSDILNTMIVTGSGTGNFNGAPFSSTFTLLLTDVEPPSPTATFVLTIDNTPNGTQVVTFTQNGEGHVEITGCPLP